MSDQETSSPKAARSSPRAMVRRFARLGLMIALQIVLLFGGAGTLRWRPGWAGGAASCLLA
jgi:hypothetical protein